MNEIRMDKPENFHNIEKTLRFCSERCVQIMKNAQFVHNWRDLSLRLQRPGVDYRSGETLHAMRTS